MRYDPVAFNERGQIVPNAGATGWSVEGQQETTELDARGRAVEGYRVQFMTGLGQRASVFVPKTQYTTVNVRAAVAAAAGLLDEVSRLSG